MGTTPTQRKPNRQRETIRWLLNTPPKPREEVKDDARATREKRKAERDRELD
jgi:hypothetical protein